MLTPTKAEDGGILVEEPLKMEFERLGERNRAYAYGLGPSRNIRYVHTKSNPPRPTRL